MTDERRTHQRLSLNLPARYDGLSGAHEARLEDIGLGGCFVNTRGHVDAGEVITVEIKMLSGQWLQLRGEVISNQPGIGFGMVFGRLTDEEQEALQEVIKNQ